MIKHPEDGLVENGTYDGDPSRDARFPHGAGAFISMAFGAALLAAVAVGVWYWRPLTQAWFGG